MYVVCYYKQLHNVEPSGSNHSLSPLNANASTEMQDIMLDFHSNLEDVLVWMIGAEAQVTEEDEDSLMDSDVESLKQLFHTHEGFMIELTNYQSKIGELLNEGQALIESNICSHDEQLEVQQQKELLNSKWEALRTKAMEKQTHLHEVLMLLQQKQLDNLRAWLITAEDKISHFGEIGPDLPAVKLQMLDHKVRKERFSVICN